MEKMIDTVVAASIEPDSWLKSDPRFKWFVEGYGYATTQTMAIPTLSHVSPEDLYFAVYAVLRGAGLSQAIEIQEMADSI